MNNSLIKFRFFSKNQKKYIYQPRIWVNDAGELNYDFNGEDLIIERWTGLNDKNQKGIYEGDILKYMTNNKPVVVRWSKVSEDNHPGFRLRDTYEQYGYYKIIGNINENLDLLK